MKTRKIELDVDFIGDQVGLTTTEEQALSDYFKQRKLEKKQTLIAPKRRSLPEAKINTLRS